MKIYLSGPMSGCVRHNHDRFHYYAAALRAKAFDVLNPAELDVEQGMCKRWCDYLIRDIPHLIRCDAIVLLPDDPGSKSWRDSRGATLEVVILHQLDRPVFQIVDRESWVELKQLHDIDLPQVVHPPKEVLV